jgi:restriction system protein
MAIPDFQSIMLPLLEFASDGIDHDNSEAIEYIATRFNLTEQDRKQLLPSGQQRVLGNRVAWARVHMRMAGLLENRARGIFGITQGGREVLEQKPAKINLKFLQSFPDYVEWRSKKKETEESSARNEDDSQTPEEALESAYENLRKALARDLVTQIKKCSPSFFERVVVDLLVKMGYGGSLKDAGEAIGQSGDEGIDGIIKEDRLGLDIIYIQAKRWQATVGRPEIQKFAGALQGQRARKGIFITTSDFSREAIEYASRIESKIVLIDGDKLSDFMIDFKIGVTPQAAYEVKRIDSDYFATEAGVE